VIIPWWVGRRRCFFLRNHHSRPSPPLEELFIFQEEKSGEERNVITLQRKEASNLQLQELFVRNMHFKESTHTMLGTLQWGPTFPLSLSRFRERLADSFVVAG